MHDRMISNFKKNLFDAKNDAKVGTMNSEVDRSGQNATNSCPVITDQSHQRNESWLKRLHDTIRSGQISKQYCHYNIIHVYIFVFNN